MEKDLIKNWLAKNRKIINKEFPKDFIGGLDCESIRMPEKILLLGEQFFGFYQLCDTNGELYFQEEELSKAKYIAYCSILKSDSISIPLNINDINTVVRAYEKHLDSMIISIKNEVANAQLKTKDDEIVRQIFNTLNLIRY